MQAIMHYAFTVREIQRHWIPEESQDSFLKIAQIFYARGMMLENFEFNIHSCLWTILIWLVSFEMRALLDSVENVWNYILIALERNQVYFIARTPVSFTSVTISAFKLHLFVEFKSYIFVKLSRDYSTLYRRTKNCRFVHLSYYGVILGTGGCVYVSRSELPSRSLPGEGCMRSRLLKKHIKYSSRVEPEGMRGMLRGMSNSL